MKNERPPEIESPDTVRAIINVFRSVNNELMSEHERSKKQYLEKWGLKEIRTSKTRTALEQ